jgi:hypothetical protein
MLVLKATLLTIGYMTFIESFRVGNNPWQLSWKKDMVAKIV